MILIIEDNPNMWSSLKRTLRTIFRVPPDVECVSDYDSAIAVLKSKAPSLIICDYLLPNLRTGLEIWDYCKRTMPQTKVLMISGIGVQDFIKNCDAMNIRPTFLPKPFTLGEFKSAIDGLMNTDLAA